MNVKILRIPLLAVFAASAVLLLVWAAFLHPVSIGLTANSSHKSILEEQLDRAEKQAAELEAMVKEKTEDNVLDTEKILAEISAASEALNLSIDRLSIGEPSVSGAFKTVSVQIEICGYANDITAFFNEFCPKTSFNTVESFSLRKVENLPWLIREVDTELPLDWWDLQSKEQEKQTADASPISLADIVGSGKMRCFAEISFTGGV